MRASKWIGAVVVLMVATAPAWSQATQPVDAAAAAEAKKPVVVSPAAKSVLDDVSAAYGKLKSLELGGSVAMNLDAAGEKAHESGEFTAFFDSSGKFRHEMKDDMLLTSNGEKAFIYQSDKKRYSNFDVIKERTALADLPDPIEASLTMQNPSLLLALSKDGATGMADRFETVDRGDDVTIEGTKYQSLTFKSNHEKQEITEQVLVHPQTHLIRQVNIDLKDRLLKMGVPQVNAAMLAIDYTKTSPNASVAATAFDWTPPSDAMLVKLQRGADLAPQGEENAPSMALVGKPAPEFKLKDLAGNETTLAAQKGHVVVLDFWATWCPPCVEGMPHLDALNKELSPKGVKAFAVNLRETKAQAQKFIEDKKLSVSVLLDTDGAVADLYKVTGIPQTVVVGKDGTIAKVFIGYGPGSEDQLKAAIEAAMK